MRNAQSLPDHQGRSKGKRQWGCGKEPGKAVQQADPEDKSYVGPSTAVPNCRNSQEHLGSRGLLPGLSRRGALLLGTQIQHSVGRISSSCKLHADTHQPHEDVLQGGSRSHADIGSKLSVSQKLSGFFFLVNSQLDGRKSPLNATREHLQKWSLSFPFFSPKDTVFL